MSHDLIKQIELDESLLSNDPDAYMNAKQLSYFKQLLTLLKEKLLQEASKTVSTLKDDNTNTPDLNDRASLEEGFALELRTRDRERKLIAKIDKSIYAIEEDDYGYCNSCGDPIGLARLKARPTATQCVECKSIDEIKEKHLRK